MIHPTEHLFSRRGLVATASQRHVCHCPHTKAISPLIIQCIRGRPWAEVSARPRVVGPRGGQPLRQRRLARPTGPVEGASVLRQIGERAEHAATERTDRAALVQRPVISQRVSALERLLADRAA